MLRVLKVPSLDKFDNLAYGFFTNEGGCSSDIYESLNISLSVGDEIENVYRNRLKVRDYFLSDEDDLSKLVVCEQTHSSDVMIIDDKERYLQQYVVKDKVFNRQEESDGIVTNQKGLVLSVATADCGNIIFYDPDAEVIGVAHAGWRGALDTIIENTVESMTFLGANPKNIHSATGSCLWKDNYKVSQEFLQEFVDENKGYDKFFTEVQKESTYLFDFPSFIKDKLKKLGLASITESLADSYDDPSFYSYRQANITGRHATAVMLK